jgi:hypothetical protein
MIGWQRLSYEYVGLGDTWNPNALIRCAQVYHAYTIREQA